MTRWTVGRFGVAAILIAGRVLADPAPGTPGNSGDHNPHGAPPGQGGPPPGQSGDHNPHGAPPGQRIPPATMPPPQSPPARAPIVMPPGRPAATGVAPEAAVDWPTAQALLDGVKAQMARLRHIRVLLRTTRNGDAPVEHRYDVDVVGGRFRVEFLTGVRYTVVSDLGCQRWTLTYADGRTLADPGVSYAVVRPYWPEPAELFELDLLQRWARLDVDPERSDHARGRYLIVARHGDRLDSTPRQELLVQRSPALLLRCATVAPPNLPVAEVGITWQRLEGLWVPVVVTRRAAFKSVGRLLTTDSRTDWTVVEVNGTWAGGGE